MIAEWEADRFFLSDRLEERHPHLVASLRSALDGAAIEVIPETSDIWCRDYMPIQLGNDTFCQFIYRPDYLKGFEHLITPPARCRLSFMKKYDAEPIILDGGNIVASWTRVILTDKIYRENPSFERPALRRRLEEIFQAECIFIPKEPYDKIGHSDGVVRFLDDKRVIVNDFSSIDPAYGARLRDLFEGKGLEVETLPMLREANKKRSDEIESAVGIYINYLRVGNVVVLPKYDHPEDDVVVEKFQHLMPSVKLRQIDCRNLAEQGGVLNCVTWTVKTDVKMGC
jgi:agmatine deiminase